MSKKPKPQWGWNATGSLNPGLIFDDDKQKICDVLHVKKLPEDIYNRLTTAIQNYQTLLPWKLDAPRASQIKVTLEQLKRQLEMTLKESRRNRRREYAKRLSKTLRNVDRKTANLISMIELPSNLNLFELSETVQPAIDQWESEKCSPENIPATLKDLMNCIDKALQNINPDLGGRPQERAPLRKIIRDFALIYEEIKGCKAGISHNPVCNSFSGPFYRFVELLLEISDIDYYSPQALASQIQIALRN